MQVTEAQKQAAIARMKQAFPRFRDWETDYGEDMYRDFSVCGVFVWGKGYHANHYYVTIITWEREWQGYLSMGQPAFMWTGAGIKDAYLLDVKGRTVGETVIKLKKAMKKLFDNLCAD